MNQNSKEVVSWFQLDEIVKVSGNTKGTGMKVKLSRMPTIVEIIKLVPSIEWARATEEPVHWIGKRSFNY